MAGEERKPRARKKKPAGDAVHAGRQDGDSASAAAGPSVTSDRTDSPIDRSAERDDTSVPSRTTAEHIEESMKSGLHPYGEVF